MVKSITKLQNFIYANKEMILKGKDRYEGCHPLWGTCYPAAYFLWELLDRKGEVFYKRINKHGNHTYIILDGEVLDPTYDQVPECFDYYIGRKKQSMMNGNKTHLMTKKLMKHFKDSEFANISKMDKDFLKFLDELREKYGKPIKINSSYRSPKHNEKVGGVTKSAHTEIPCKASDIHCNSSNSRMKLIALGLSLGCRRIGVGETFLHFDFSTNKPQDVIWTYY